MMEVMSVRTSIRSGMQSAGRCGREAYMKPVLIPGEIEKTVIESIGEERLEQSIIEGGSQGIRCEKSYMSPVTWTYGDPGKLQSVSSSAILWTNYSTDGRVLQIKRMDRI